MYVHDLTVHVHMCMYVMTYVCTCVRTCTCMYIHICYVVIDSFGMAYLLWHLFIHCFMGISLQSDHLCAHIRLLVCVCMCACTFLVPNSSATCIQSNYVGITLCTHHSASPYTHCTLCVGICTE